MNLDISHIPEHEHRAQMTWDILGLWRDIPGVHPAIITPPVGCSNREFQRYRRMRADMLGGEYYVLSDDDCFPQATPAEMPQWVAGCLSVLRRHPQYAILSPLPANASIVEWTPENYRTESDEEVMEHISVGGIRFCRKLSLPEWPPMGEMSGYDFIHCQALRERGWRVGYLRNFKMVHAGEGNSTVW